MTNGLLRDPRAFYMAEPENGLIYMIDKVHPYIRMVIRPNFSQSYF